MLNFLLALVMADPLASITKTAYFDIEIDGHAAGRITFGLFGDVVPRTVDNFAKLCDGSFGLGNSGKLLTYTGSEFHRIIPGFLA